MRRLSPILIVTIVLLGSSGLWELAGARASIDTPPDVPSLVVGLRFRLDGHDSTWGVRVALYRTDRYRRLFPVRGQVGERLNRSDLAGPEIDITGQRLSVLQFVGRLGARGVLHLIGFRGADRDH